MESDDKVEQAKKFLNQQNPSKIQIDSLKFSSNDVEKAVSKQLPSRARSNSLTSLDRYSYFFFG